MRIGFIGLGVMGYPMASHLARAGHELLVFNRSPEKADRWAGERGGAAVRSAGAAAKDREALMLCVGNDDDVRHVVTETLPELPAGAVIVDHTTTSARLARELAAAAAARGCAFVDAPVSGGQAGAERGQLSVMAGGEAVAFAKVAPVLAAYAKAVRRIGGPGAGQLTKMVNQICIAGVVQGLAEAVAFTRRAGLDPDLVLAAVSQGAAQSWQMDNRWKTMVEGRFDFGFAVDWMRKDLGLVLEEARANGAWLEITALVDQFYAEVQSMGGRRWDTSSLAARLTR
ncbi:MAG TPA: NAD(P)-dependent oxidoreductase [Caulobacteraceae bacterium]|nr:NAD(P)-dependent oxidoreductase [Caulobacteraceae bacterium]